MHTGGQVQVHIALSVNHFSTYTSTVLLLIPSPPAVLCPLSREAIPGSMIWYSSNRVAIAARMRSSIIWCTFGTSESLAREPISEDWSSVSLNVGRRRSVKEGLSDVGGINVTFQWDMFC